MLRGSGLVSWKLVFTKQAQKDAKKLAASGLKAKACELLGIIKNNPLQTLPPFEKLAGNLTGAISRRTNVQHRIVYQIYQAGQTIKVIRLWTRYE